MSEISKNKKYGFTMIELIVVIAVFLFIIGAAINIFLSIVQSQKNVLAQQQILSQISYAEEYMSKALRMAKTEELENCLIDSQNNDHQGYIYLLTRYNQAYKGIKFLNQTETNPSTGNGVCQEFYIDNGILWDVKDGGQPVALTSSGLTINSARFVINGDINYQNCGEGGTIYCGASNNDSVQPRVTILLSVTIPGSSCANDSQCGSGQTCSSGKCTLNRTIQTTISQRNLNAK